MREAFGYYAGFYAARLLRLIESRLSLLIFAVTEILLAAYQSAATGRKVSLPFETDAASPQALLG